MCVKCLWYTFYMVLYPFYCSILEEFMKIKYFMLLLMFSSFVLYGCSSGSGVEPNGIVQDGSVGLDWEEVSDLELASLEQLVEGESLGVRGFSESGLVSDEGISVSGNVVKIDLLAPSEVRRVKLYKYYFDNGLKVRVLARTLDLVVSENRILDDAPLFGSYFYYVAKVFMHTGESYFLRLEKVLTFDDDGANETKDFRFLNFFYAQVSHENGDPFIRLDWGLNQDVSSTDVSYKIYEFTKARDGNGEVSRKVLISSKKRLEGDLNTAVSGLDSELLYRYKMIVNVPDALEVREVASSEWIDVLSDDLGKEAVSDAMKSLFSDSYSIQSSRYSFRELDLTWVYFESLVDAQVDDENVWDVSGKAYHVASLLEEFNISKSDLSGKGFLDLAEFLEIDEVLLLDRLDSVDFIEFSSFKKDGRLRYSVESGKDVRSFLGFQDPKHNAYLAYFSRSSKTQDEFSEILLTAALDDPSSIIVGFGVGAKVGEKVYYFRGKELPDSFFDRVGTQVLNNKMKSTSIYIRDRLGYNWGLPIYLWAAQSRKTLGAPFSVITFNLDFIFSVDVSPLVNKFVDRSGTD